VEEEGKRAPCEGGRHRSPGVGGGGRAKTCCDRLPWKKEAHWQYSQGRRENSYLCSCRNAAPQRGAVAKGRGKPALYIPGRKPTMRDCPLERGEGSKTMRRPIHKGKLPLNEQDGEKVPVYEADRPIVRQPSSHMERKKKRMQAANKKKKGIFVATGFYLIKGPQRGNEKKMCCQCGKGTKLGEAPGEKARECVRQLSREGRRNHPPEVRPTGGKRGGEKGGSPCSS